MVCLIDLMLKKVWIPLGKHLNSVMQLCLLGSLGYSWVSSRSIATIAIPFGFCPTVPQSI